MIDAKKLLKAASTMDWQQVILNGGPPCFRLESDGKFCGRAERWAGHKNEANHAFVSLERLLALMDEQAIHVTDNLNDARLTSPSGNETEWKRGDVLTVSADGYRVRLDERLWVTHDEHPDWQRWNITDLETGKKTAGWIDPSVANVLPPPQEAKSPSPFSGPYWPGIERWAINGATECKAIMDLRKQVERILEDHEKCK